MVARNAFLVTYLAIQIALPLRGVLRSRFDSHGSFSWNMYSQNYACAAQYHAMTRDRGPVQIEHRYHLNRPSRVEMLYNRESLPWLHRYLCEEYGDRTGFESLRGMVECTWNGSPLVPLVDPEVDLCRAENYGVTER